MIPPLDSKWEWDTGPWVREESASPQDLDGGVLDDMTGSERIW